MSIFSIFLISVGLAMDAFAVALADGIAIKKLTLKKIIIIGAFFGLFQFIMPLVGFLGGSTFNEYIKVFDHWLVFFLLCVIGGKMIHEAVKGKGCEVVAEDKIMSIKNLSVQALATSIDAFAVGISFAVIETDILYSSAIIGIVAFIFSCGGVFLGKKIGCVFEKHAEILGGSLLIFIAIKTIAEHMFF